MTDIDRTAEDTRCRPVESTSGSGREPLERRVARRRRCGGCDRQTRNRPPSRRARRWSWLRPTASPSAGEAFSEGQHREALGRLGRRSSPASHAGRAGGAGEDGTGRGRAGGPRRVGSACRTRRDPVDLLGEQAATRVAELVPIRYGRMLVSPFTFYRGAAYLMAADLAATPRTGLARPALRGCAPVQLRRVRLARPAAGVQHQRLRRDAAGPVRVGREAAGRELRRRRP